MNTSSRENFQIRSGFIPIIENFLGPFLLQLTLEERCSIVRLLILTLQKLGSQDQRLRSSIQLERYLFDMIFAKLSAVGL